jgi:hypothetical protein
MEEIAYLDGEGDVDTNTRGATSLGGTVATGSENDPFWTTKLSFILSFPSPFLK